MDGIVTFVFLILGAVFIYRNYVENGKLRKQVDWLTKEIDLLEKEVSELLKTLGKGQEKEIEKAALVKDHIMESAEQVKEKPSLKKEEAANTEEPPSETTAPREDIKIPNPFYRAEKDETASNGGISGFEKDLSSRWMIWLGGIAFALGGAFLVKYSIDAGLLNPAVRVVMGTLLGVVLTIAGEILRQRRSKIGWLEGTPDYLPVAISGAGFFTAFAAIYASYALYHFIPALMAFIVLASLSFLATGFALYQGRFFAYLGMIGGLLIPMLVSTGSGNAWALFPYLLLMVAASLWVSRKQAWVDVVASSLILAMLWVVLWIFTNWQMGDIIPVGGYLLILTGLNMALLNGASPLRKTDPKLSGMFATHTVTKISDIVTLLSVVLLVSIVRLDHYSILGFSLITAGLLVQGYATYRSAENDMGGVIAIFGIIFMLATWHIEDLLPYKLALGVDTTHVMAWSAIMPPSLEKFLLACGFYGALIGFAIFIRLPEMLRKPLWATMGNLVPLVILIIAYFRIKDLDTSIYFAIAALILACLFTLEARFMHRQSEEQGMTPVAAYASGASMALALGLSMVLREAWLSFALALEIVALAYIWQKTAVRGLRTLALLLTSTVLIRLFFNENIFEYHHGGGAMPVINWLFYGYGLTAVLFAVAWRMFDEKRAGDRLVSVLKAGAIMLLISFITLETRVLFSQNNNLTGAITSLEIALHTINWAAATTLLMWREVKDQDRLLGMLRRFMSVITLIGLLIGGGFENDIFSSRANVGNLPVFNLLFLQLFIPAILFGVKAYLSHQGDRKNSIMIYGILSFLTMWYWLTAEVHHYFHPGGGGYASDWEHYSYSIVWLLYSIGLLVSGLKYNSRKIRMAGLGVLSIVVIKVFLFDMNSLEGLSRALSFMGLGAALIGIGYLYQRLNNVNGDGVELKA